IARANRVNEGKTNGLIVDYCGILKNLRQALADLAQISDQGRREDHLSPHSAPSTVTDQKSH
ncbi:MAG: hypothetical protein ACKPH4_18380, partial [Microcystis panniformis]